MITSYLQFSNNITSRLHHKAKWKELFDQNDLNRDTDSIIDAVLLLSIFHWHLHFSIFSQLLSMSFQWRCLLPHAIHWRNGLLPVFQLARFDISFLWYLLPWSCKTCIVSAATVSNSVSCITHFLTVLTLSCTLFS